MCVCVCVCPSCLHPPSGQVILYIKMNVCLFVCMYVCLYHIQIHISEPIGTKLCTRLPLGLEETVGYVWARNS